MAICKLDIRKGVLKQFGSLRPAGEKGRLRLLSKALECDEWVGDGFAAFERIAHEKGVN